MQVRLVTKHDQELLLSYEIASAKIHEKPISAYLDTQLSTIKETVTALFKARGHFEPYEQ